MGVQVTKKDSPQAPAMEKVLLELTVISRYVVHGVLYEKGRAYEFTPEQAETMLRLQDDRGLPVFRRWKPKPVAKRLDQQGPVVVDMTTGAPKVRVTQGQNKVEVDFTPEELAEAGINLDEGGGDMSLSDLNGGVKV
jgi:hypothetical protein